MPQLPADYRPINFNDIFFTAADKQTLIDLVDENIKMFGYQCTLYHYNGSQSHIGDPLYGDTLSTFDRNLESYSKIETWIYLDYVRFNSVLHSYGLALEEDTTLVGNMMLSDSPTEDDLIDIKLPYDDIFYRFKIGRTDVHRNICYNVVLDIYRQDNIKNNEVIKYNVGEDTANTTTITAATSKAESTKDRRY